MRGCADLQILYQHVIAISMIKASGFDMAFDF